MALHFSDLFNIYTAIFLWQINIQDGGSLDQVLKEAKRIPEEILGKVSIAVSVPFFCYYLILCNDIYMAKIVEMFWYHFFPFRYPLF